METVLPPYAATLERPAIKSRRPNAVLFGLGNYAKTSIIPNIKGNIDLERVHEVDPDQLPVLAKNRAISLDTSPKPDPTFSLMFGLSRAFITLIQTLLLKRSNKVHAL